jgi:hypothetical protein
MHPCSCTSSTASSARRRQQLRDLGSRGLGDGLREQPHRLNMGRQGEAGRAILNGSSSTRSKPSPAKAFHASHPARSSASRQSNFHRVGAAVSDA